MTNRHTLPPVPVRALFASLIAAALLLTPGLTPRAQAQVPTPESVIGWEPGADYRLADYDQIREYFRRVADASDRVELERIGTSAEGRAMWMAKISTPENLANQERYREIARRMAMAEDLTDEEARQLASEGKAVVWIDAGLHATEVATAQHSPKLLHRLATGQDVETRRILEDAIVLLMPFMNPDGLDIVVDWYERNLGTEYETAPLPVLYHKYVGHDNNRDWFMNLMPETRAVTAQLWHRWYPQIVYNHHQTGPFPSRIFVPPFKDPMNPNIPALVTRGINLVGSAMAYRFAQEDKPGVVSRESYTQWWNGGMRTAPYFHNQIGILTETNLYEYATPRYYEPDRMPSTFGTGRSTERPSVFYANPWEGGWWRIGDAVEYMLTASMAVADIGARLKDKWLYDTYRMGRRAIEAGEQGGPYAYVLPAEQWDSGAAAELVTVLRQGAVEVHRAGSSFRAGGTEYGAGSWIAYAGQPYRAHLMDMMEPQLYPDRREFPGGPPITPYDLAGWTLPMQMGVQVDRIDEPFDRVGEPVTARTVEPDAGTVEGSGPVWLLTSARNDAHSAAWSLLGEGGSMERATEGFTAGGTSWPAGTFLLRADRGRLEELAAEHGLHFRGAGQGAEVETVAVNGQPRIGLYRSWVSNMDEGWTRWILEQWGMPYDTLRDDEVRAGDLSSYDVVVLPEQGARSILNGHPEGTMPEEYTGGVGVEGAAALERFVRGGGTLVALDHASEFATQQFGLPLENGVAGLSDEEFFIPGSLIRLSVDTSDPIAWGMQEETAGYFVRSLAFDVIPPASEEEGAEGPKRGTRRVDVAVRYAGDDLLMSGWELGASQHIGGQPAAVRVPHGEGQVVLTAFRPQFRAQPRGTFKLLFNALLASTTEGLPTEGDVGAGQGDGE